MLAEGTNQFLEAQLEDARRQLVDNEKRLENYRRSHDGQLPNQLEANMQGLHNTEMQLQALGDVLNRERDRLDTVKRLVADLEANEYIQGPAPSAPVVETATDRYHAAEKDLAAMQLRLKPDHPDVVRARKLLVDLKKAADEEEAARPVSAMEAPMTPAERLRRTRLNDATREVALLERDIAEKTADEAKLRQNLSGYQQRIEATPSRESELIELTRDYGTLQSMYQGLLAKKQDSQISANLERRQIGEQFRILDPARLPSRPFTPNRPRFYGHGCRRWFRHRPRAGAPARISDRTLRSEDDVRVAIGLPVLATVPLIHLTDRAGQRGPGGPACGDGCGRGHGWCLRRAQVCEVAIDVQVVLRPARASVRSVAEPSLPVSVEAACRGARASSLWPDRPARSDGAHRRSRDRERRRWCERRSSRHSVPHRHSASCDCRTRP